MFVHRREGENIGILREDYASIRALFVDAKNLGIPYYAAILEYQDDVAHDKGYIFGTEPRSMEIWDRWDKIRTMDDDKLSNVMWVKDSPYLPKLPRGPPPIKLSRYRVARKGDGRRVIMNVSGQKIGNGKEYDLTFYRYFEARKEELFQQAKGDKYFFFAEILAKAPEATKPVVVGWIFSNDRARIQSTELSREHESMSEVKNLSDYVR